jgi:hypothetical protein
MYFLKHTDQNGNPTDHTIILEARDIVAEALRAWPEDYEGCEAFINETVDGHQWVIYNYAALQIVAHCSTGEAEASLEDIGYQPENCIAAHARAIVYQMLLDACLTELDAKTIKGE